MAGVTDRAALDDIPLMEGERNSGSAFVLDDQAPENAITEVGDGWVVEVRAASLVVVARGPQVDSAEEAHESGTRAAQRGLDLFSMRGSCDLLIRRAEDENLAWWVDGGRRVLRATATAPLRITVGAAVRVTDASGQEKPLPAEPEPEWHPSFRYFRLAQVSEEVFDAYRNLYLALESVLSTATPKNQGERDFDWIGRALTEAGAGGLNLAAFAPPGADDPAEAIRSDLYGETRTATFHAKAGHRTLVPLDPVDRRSVLASLSRLAGLYLELCNRVLGFRRLGGFMFRAGFDLMIGDSFVQELEVHVTDDPIRIDKTHTTINPGGGRVKSLATRPSPEFDQPFLRTVIGEAPVDELAELTHIDHLATIAKDGTPVTGGQLEARLTLGGFDVFQALMGIRGLNVRQPRSFYSA